MLGSAVPPEAPWRVGPRALLVPVKAFAEAKGRLAPALSPNDRAALARRLASGVVAAAGSLPVAVVCDDQDVAAWARHLGALVIWEPGQGLNRAVEAGVAHLTRAGVQQVVVAAGDLARVSDLSWVADFAGFTIVPDRRHDGTNVIGVPTSSNFSFAYGPGSYRRHLAAARRSGAPVRVVHGSELAWDVDVPEDLVSITDVPRS